MSIKMLSWALEQPVSDCAAKLVLISICDAHNGENGACYPSKARIAQQASISVETVTRKLKWLEENGWIESIPRFDNTGRQTSNSYIINTEESGGVNLPTLPTDDMGEGVTADTPLKGTVRKNRKDTVVSAEPDTVFESLWAAFPKTGYPSKANALKAFLKLSETDKGKCISAARVYAAWHKGEVAKRSDCPALHLATFINQRRFDNIEPVPAKPNETIDWQARVNEYHKNGYWPSIYGPMPGFPGCKVPAALLIQQEKA